MTLRNNAAHITKHRFRVPMRWRKATVGMLMVSPFVVGFIVFYLRGLILTARFSLSDMRLLARGGYELTFAGVKHYIYALREHASFKQILTRSMGDVIVDVPLILFFSLFVAVMLNSRFRGRSLARSIFFLPVILNAPAIADALDMSRRLMLGGDSPASSLIMDTVGKGNINVAYYIDILGSIAMPRAALSYIVGAVGRINTIITSSGVQIVIFIAALQSISPSLYEVARIEGATAYESFWKITLPMVSPLIVTNIVYTIVDSFVRSDVITLSFDTIFGAAKQYGLGSAISLISMVALCGILAIFSAIAGKFAFYQN